MRLEDERPRFLAFIQLQLQKASENLLPRDTVLSKNLGDALSTALDVGDYKSVQASGECRLKTDQTAHGRPFALVPCVEIVSVHSFSFHTISSPKMRGNE